MNRPERVEVKVGGGVAARLAGLTPLEKTVVALSVVAASFLLIDPLIYEVIRGFNPGVRRFFRSFTDLGKSSASLLPAAVLFILLAALRTRDIGLKAAAAYGYLAQIVAYVFASVALAGITASLAKAVFGRARPKLFDTLGSLAFEPFAFSASFASFPSGHATSIFALAAALALVWPRFRVLLFVAAGWIAATRFLIGSHYLSDVVAGALLGATVPRLVRARLAERRWLFAAGADGNVRLRGRRLLAWSAAEIRASLLQRGGRAERADADSWS